MKKLSESVWGDVRRRAEGRAERKEDDINNANVDGLVLYLKKIYENLHPGKGFYIHGSTTSPALSEVSVPVYYNTETTVEAIWVYMQMYPSSNYIYLSQRFANRCKNTYNKMKDTFDVEMIDEDRGRWHICVSPKDNSSTTNKFFIEVIDFMLANVEEPYKPLLGKE